MDPARFLSRSDKPVPGTVEVVTVPQPAAGANWSVTVAGGAQWRVQSVRANLNTSATVANRFAAVQFTVTGLIVWRAADPVALPAGSIMNYSWSIGDAYATNTNAFGNSTAPLLGMWLPDQSVIGGVASALQAGDQWSSIVLVVEKCLYSNTMLTELQDEIYEAEYGEERVTHGVADFMHTMGN